MKQVADGIKNEIGRLRENVWHIYSDKASSYFQTVDEVFEVPTEEALEFIKIRSHFSGSTTLEEISERSGVGIERVREIVSSLVDINLFQTPVAAYSDADLRSKIRSLTSLWARELKTHYIANRLVNEPFSKNVLVGWLLEMYHYIHSFPEAIEFAALKCRDPKTKEVVQHYAEQEKGHEEFVLKTLINLGLKESEVQNSHPLPSTHLVTFLMEKLFTSEPTMVFAMALLVESQEFDDENIELYKQRLAQKFNTPSDALNPYFEHQRIDTEMGHGMLMDKYIELIDVSDKKKLDASLNALHDLKHAFELQTEEIISYYGGEMQGRYFPRIPMSMLAI